MKRLETKCSGAWPTMITPFDENGQIDWDGYRAMIEWYIAHDVGGLYANCLSSEMYALDNEERLRLAAEAVKWANGRVRVATTGNLGDSFEDHLVLCQRMAETGVDVVMLLVPPFHDNDADLERYFFALTEKVVAPLGLYECPVPRSYHLGIDLVRRLAESGRFAAYKETSEKLDKILALQCAIVESDLSLLQACSSYLLESIRAGALGTMCIAAIHLPDLVAAIVKAAQRGDEDAERLQSGHCAMHLAQRTVHPQGSKYLLRKRGLPISERCRLANAKLSTEAMAALDYAARAWFTPDGELQLLAREAAPARDY